MIVLQRTYQITLNNAEAEHRQREADNHIKLAKKGDGAWLNQRWCGRTNSDEGGQSGHTRVDGKNSYMKSCMGKVDLTFAAA